MSDGIWATYTTKVEVVSSLALMSARSLVGEMATAIKLTPGLFIVYFAASRQWAAALRAAATALACELAAALISPDPSRRYWMQLWFNPGRTGNPKVYFNQSIYGAILRFGLPHAVWAVLALAAAGFELAGREVARDSPPSPLADVAAVLADAGAAVSAA